MTRKRSFALVTAAAVIAFLTLGAVLGTGSGKKGPKGPPETGFIEGKVTSGKKHPEAGVWVIAETSDLPTPYRKIVVTDDQGRFVLPELPEAEYQVWVRGYGLRDSGNVPVTVRHKGNQAPVSIETAKADSAQEAAANYPASYWLSLFKPPADTASLPGARNQHAWVSDFKLGCQLCHQMGSASARGMRGNRAGLDAGLKKAGSMDSAAVGLGRDALLDALADWGGRIAGGPDARGAAATERHRAQPRDHPVGLGRPLRLRARPDRHRQAQPALYPDGKIWGVDLGNDRLLSVDPTTNEADELHVPTVGGFATPWGHSRSTASSRSATPPRAGRPRTPTRTTTRPTRTTR